MLNNNYGYACVNMQLAYPKQYGDSSESRIISHRTMVKKTLLEKGINYASELSLKNCKDLFEIINRSAEIFEIKIIDRAAMELASRSRGTPRIANRILRRARDFAEVEGTGEITLDIAKSTLKHLGIDDIGLDNMDRKILNIIIDNFSGGPVGLKSLAVALGEDVMTIEDVYEPFLIKKGFILRTPRGRVAQESAYNLLGKKIKNNEKGLF